MAFNIVDDMLAQKWSAPEKKPDPVVAAIMAANKPKVPVAQKVAPSANGVGQKLDSSKLRTSGQERTSNTKTDYNIVPHILMDQDQNNSWYKNELNKKPLGELSDEMSGLEELIAKSNQRKPSITQEIGRIMASDDLSKSLEAVLGDRSKLKEEQNLLELKGRSEKGNLAQIRGMLADKGLNTALLEQNVVPVEKKQLDFGNLFNPSVGRGTAAKDVKLSEKSQWKNAQELGNFNAKIKQYAKKVREYGWQPVGEQSKELGNLRSILSTESQRLMKQGVLREGDKPYVEALLTSPDSLIKGGIEEIFQGGNEGRLKALKQAYDYFEAQRQGNINSLKIDYPEALDKVSSLESMSDSGVGIPKRKVTVEDTKKMSKEELKKYLGE